MQRIVTNFFDVGLFFEEEQNENVQITETTSTEIIATQTEQSTQENQPISDDQPTQQKNQTTSQENRQFSNQQDNVIYLTKLQFDNYILEHPDHDIVPLAGRPKSVVTTNGQKASAFRYQLNYMNPRTVV